MDIFTGVLVITALYFLAGLFVLALAGLNSRIALWWSMAPDPEWMYKGAALAIWPYVLYRGIRIAFFEKE